MSIIGTTLGSSICRQVAAQISLGNASWDAEVLPRYEPATGASTVCSVEEVSFLDGIVRVDDVGGMTYGRLICRQLSALRRPYLGLNTRTVDYAEAARLGRADLQDYVEATEVTPGGPAASADIRIGDVVTGLAGLWVFERSLDFECPVDCPTTLEGNLSGLEVGQVVDLHFVRDGQDRTAQVTLSSWPN